MNIYEEIQAHKHYWIDLLESKVETMLEDTKPVAYTDLLNNQTVHIVDIKIYSNDKLLSDKESVNGISLFGIITTNIINNL